MNWRGFCFLAAKKGSIDENLDLWTLNYFETMPMSWIEELMKAIIVWTLLFGFVGQAWSEETVTTPAAGAVQGEVAVSEAVESEKKPDRDNSSYVICKNKKEVRTIRVELTGSVCRALYSKMGKDELVAEGTQKHCYGVVDNIRTNLEKSFWKCKDISPERVSSSVE